MSVAIIIILWRGIHYEHRENKTGLKRQKLGLFAIVGMIYSLTASGAWGIEDMIPGGGPGLTLIMLVLLPFVWGLPQAFTDAELGSALPDEGGPYVWVRETLGEFWGFQMGWWRTLGGYFDTVTYVALAAAFMTSFFGLTPVQEYGVKIAIIVIFTIVNLQGVKDVAFINTFISSSILIAFAIVSIIGFAHFNTNPFSPIIPEGQGILTSLGEGLAVGLWMYGGWEAMSMVAGEVDQPQLIPKGLLISIPLIIGTYVIPTAAGLASVGNWSAWASDGISYIDILKNYAPAWAPVVFLVIAMLSNIAMFNGYIASTARGFFVMSADNLCPKFLVKVSKKKGVPYVGILSVAVVSMFLMSFSFVELVVATVTMSLFASSLTQLAGIVRRKRHTHPDGPFKTQMSDGVFTVFTFIPIIVAVLTLYLDGSSDFVHGLIGVISGPIAYIVFKRMYGGLTVDDPVNNPVNPQTGLAFGDTKRFAFVLLVWAVLGILGILFFPVFEEVEAGNMLFIEVASVICGIVGVIMMVIATKKDNCKIFSK